MSARVGRCPRALNDHFKLMNLGKSLTSWQPKKGAPDAEVSQTTGEVFAMYELPGMTPATLIRAWQRRDKGDNSELARASMLPDDEPDEHGHAAAEVLPDFDSS